MNEIIIESFLEFHNIIQELYNNKNATIFRGLSNDKYELIPSIYRLNPTHEKIEIIEKRLLHKFKSSSIAYNIARMPTNDWEWLALAQHFGLPTKLMDWTYNPLVALFFAVEKESDTNSCVYVTWKYENLKKFDSNPFSYNYKANRTGYNIYRPTYITQRIVNQASIFSIHPNKDYKCNTENIIKIIIKNDCRKSLKDTLFKYGINYRNLFPDLEGLCKDLTRIDTRCY